MERKLLMTILEELCKINGTSGREEKVREYILNKIAPVCKCKITPLGCLIAEYKGKPTDKKLIISAHMDEVGLIVTNINDDGTLAVNCVGGVNADAVIGRCVVLENGMAGCIGSRAVHNMSPEEREHPANFDGLYADFGAKDKAEAEKYVSPGDNIYFEDGYTITKDGYIYSKAIDDRAGCAAMIAMILENALEYDTTFTFVTQEEIGLRGARTAAYITDPDYALVLESTTAADIPLSEGAARCCELGKGAVVSYMDRSTMYDRKLFDMSKRLSAENNIPWQTKTVVAGGNDSGAIHISRGGVKTCAISVPTRYLHTPSCTALDKDFFAVYDLAVAMANEICG